MSLLKKLIGIREPKNLREKLLMDGFRSLMEGYKGKYEVLFDGDKFVVYDPIRDKMVESYDRNKK